MFTINGKYTEAKVMIDNVDESCMKQIYEFINHPAFTNPVSIMPDTHAGKGAVIGFTMKKTGKIIPNVIGVDIGCGMLSINLGKLDIELSKLDSWIRNNIPMGFNKNNEVKFFDVHLKSEITHLCDKLRIDVVNVLKSCGSLGGGNHFIEVGKDEEENIWLTIHSGSRNFGLQVCTYHQKKAFEYCNNHDFQNELNELKNKYEGIELGQKIKELKNSQMKVSKELSYLEGDDVEEYLDDMNIAQKFAKENRMLIAQAIGDYLKFSAKDIIEIIESVHNYIDFKDNIIRKGAISSYKDEKMIIPFNMRDGILICEGKSNPEWNYSAPHGAGRVMSRREARENIKLSEFKEQMDGIYSTSVCQSTLDEAPDAYKDSKIIENAIEPTATIVNRIKPILNIKSN